jgi:large subunit ribosomal protein L21
MIAIIQSGGKQYMVSKGDKIQVEKLSGEKDAKITFDKVLANLMAPSITSASPS